MQFYFISLFNLFTLQELRLMAGIGIEIELQELGTKLSLVTRIGIEIGLQELGSKFGYRNWDRSWVTGIEIEVGDRNRD